MQFLYPRHTDTRRTVKDTPVGREQSGSTTNSTIDAGDAQLHQQHTTTTLSRRLPYRHQYACSVPYQCLTAFLFVALFPFLPCNVHDGLFSCLSCRPPDSERLKSVDLFALWWMHFLIAGGKKEDARGRGRIEMLAVPLSSAKALVH